MITQSRRRLLRGLSAAALAQCQSLTAPLVGQFAGLLGLAAASSPGSAAEQYGDREAMSAWMDRWLLAPGAVSGALHMGRFADRMYWLDRPIRWSPSAGQSPLPEVSVPVGFVTDLASVPRIFWSVFPTDGVYTFPAIVHDYLYWSQTLSREDSDLVFKYGMEDMNVDAATVATIHAAVRVGGGGPWSEIAKKKAKGEKRILKNMPDDPTITWESWRTRPGVLS